MRDDGGLVGDTNAIFRISWTWHLGDTIALSEEAFIAFADVVKTELSNRFQKSKFVYQVERCPTTNRLHYQGHINLKTKLRCDTFRQQIIDLMPLVYTRPSSKAGEAEAEFYCLKEETRVAGPWADKEHIFPDWSNLTEPSDWMIPLKDILLGPMEDRYIYWVWEEEGCTGKSHFATWMEVKHNIIGLGLGKAADNFYAVSELPRRGYIFDIPRTLPNSFDWAEVYMSLEKIKDRNFLSTKYKPKKVLLPVIPHIIVFSNYPPKKEALSKDRWKVFKIVEKQLQQDFTYNT